MPDREIMHEDHVRITLNATLGSDKADYDVTLIKAGDTLTNWRFPAPVLKAAVDRFQGASCFVDHVGFWGSGASVRDLVGVMADVTWDEDAHTKGALTGRLRLSNAPAADWVENLVDQIIEDRAKDLPVPNIGLSADMFSGYYMDGRTRVATEIRSVYSVDLVFYPASGGSFDRVLNSVRGGQHMPDDKTTTPKEAPVKSDPPPAPQETRVTTEVPAAVPAPVETEVQDTALAIDNATAADDAAEKAQGLLRAQCQTVLEGQLTWCDLPQPMKEAIRAQFTGRVFAPDALDAEIARYRTMLAGMLEDKVITGAGDALDDPRVSGMLTSLDRVQMAFERLMGLQLPDDHSDIARLTGIRELYLMLSGDYDFYGRFDPARVQLANVTTASMTSVVKNVLNKVLLQAYNVRPKWWTPVVYEEDFGTLNQVTLIKSGGIGNLPTVAEGAGYTELDWSDNEETADFVKKGGYIGITLEMFDRDDVGAVKRIPREIGNAAWRTLSGLVSAIFTANAGVGPTMADAVALFDAGGHTNLLTTALSAAQWDVIIQAVYQQTEPTSSAVLGIRPKYCLVPIELERTALTIFEQPWSAEATYHHIEPRYKSGSVIVVPEWTDANDWAAACAPEDCPGICIGYRYGREPELFVADDQVVGSMFTNDEMRIKARFFVAVGVADYRPLHKSNVA